MQPNVRLVTRRELKSVYGVPYSLTHLYRLMSAEPPAFPLAVKLTQHRVAWVASEVEAWIEQRVACRDGRDAP